MKKKLFTLFLITCFLNSNSQNFGIGTASPQFKLDVHGVINNDSGYYYRGNLVLSDSFLISKNVIADTGKFKRITIDPGVIPANTISLNVHGGINTDDGYYYFGSRLLSHLPGDRTVVGVLAGGFTPSGQSSTWVGSAAGLDGDHFGYETSIGANSVTGGGRSTAIGQAAQARFNNSIAIGYNAIAPAANTVRIGNTNISAILANVGITITSDKRKKENLCSVNGEEILQKIAKMPLASWNLKGQDSKNLRHYGPMAQDFYNAFGRDKYGYIGNDTTINSQDFDAINMIAIQALQKRTESIKELKEDNRALKDQVAMLENELADMKKGIVNQNVLLKNTLAEMQRVLADLANQQQPKKETGNTKAILASLK